MPDTADKALLKEIAEQIEASTERCRTANLRDIHSAEAVAQSQESIARSRSQIVRIDGSRAAREPTTSSR